MTHLRLLADDLTGALDSAAGFVPLTGPVSVTWHAVAAQRSVAFDCGTRDLPAEQACESMERFSHLLDDGAPAFKKIDSLLRGHVALELAVCMRRFDHCVLAPAFPFQGRITRNGRQLVHSGGGWRDTGVDLSTELHALGVAARTLDAETDADLDSIVAEGRRLAGRVLWCGTGGLAGALAEHKPVPCPVLPPPILALVGSDHAVSRAQIAAVPASLRNALITCEPSPGSDRHAARAHIGATFATLLGRVERPGTLFVTGGATLRDLCDALGVTRLEVDGAVEPGVPTSLSRGGAWDGQRFVSKSGAFGDTGFLARLLKGTR
jgi:D-threonate/D-erythronate kinase